MTEQPERRGAGRADPTAGSLPGQDPTDLPDFGLVSDDGNRAMQRVVVEVATALERGEWDRRTAIEHLSDRVRELSTPYPEVIDLTVRESVLRELTPAFRGAGEEPPEPFEF